MTRFCRVIRKRKLIPLLLVTSLVVGWWAHKFSVYYSGHIVAQSIAPGNGQAAIAIDRPSFLPIGHRRIIRVYSIVSGTEKKQVYEYSARESLDGRIRFIWTKDGEYFLLVGRNLGVSDPRLKTSTDEDVLLLYHSRSGTAWSAEPNYDMLMLDYELITKLEFADFALEKTVIRK